MKNKNIITDTGVVSGFEYKVTNDSANHNDVLTLLYNFFPNRNGKNVGSEDALIPCQGREHIAHSLFLSALGIKDEDKGAVGVLKFSFPGFYSFFSIDVSIKFSDGSSIEKELDGNGGSIAFWMLDEFDCEQLITKEISKVVVEKDYEQFIYDVSEVAPHNNEPFTERFAKYIESFIYIMREKFNWIPKDEDDFVCFGEDDEDDDIIDYSEEFDPCYVYLMKDTANGFYKIGMSKDPYYRESTLQSEKPAIEKICDKKFPDREMAAAIEHSLHKAMEKKRIRGEWFNLDERDVWKVKETLK